MAQKYIRFKGLVDNSEQVEDDESIKRKAESMYRIELVSDEDAPRNYIKRVLDKGVYTTALVALKSGIQTPEQLNQFLKPGISPEEKAKVVRYMQYILTFENAPKEP